LRNPDQSYDQYFQGILEKHSKIRVQGKEAQSKETSSGTGERTQLVSPSTELYGWVCQVRFDFVYTQGPLSVEPYIFVYKNLNQSQA
jgi:hypothetical protein